MSVDGPISLFLGTWRTRFTNMSPNVPIPIPIEAMATFRQEGDQLRYTAETIYPDGKTALIEATFKVDGKPYPLHGSFLGDAVTFQQTGPHTLVATATRGGSLSGTASARVSTDGFTLTTLWQVFLPDGKSVTYTTVGDRQTEKAHGTPSKG